MNMSNEFRNFYYNTGNKVVVDTNLLLLLLIGRINKNLIENFKRTDEFTKNDFDLLFEILKHFDNIIVTPNILTEVDNFTKNLKNPENKRLAIYYISKWLNEGFIQEELIKSKILCNESCFFYFGIADTSITKISEEKIGVITKDGKLYYELITNGIQAINFKKYMDKKQQFKGSNIV
jgi:rRNA-processing protein FCF1